MDEAVNRPFAVPVEAWLRGMLGVVLMNGTFSVLPDGEAPEAFARRIDRGEYDATDVTFTADRPTLAALFTGNIELPAESESYVLFPERIHGSVAASDWIR